MDSWICLAAIIFYRCCTRGSEWAIFRIVNFHALLRVDVLRPYNWVTTDAYLEKLGRSQPHNNALNDIQASLTNRY